MKKILTLAFAILCMVSVFAADNVDIIIKTNSEKIEALIQEVSDTEIRYKKANNPNGPMFVIKLDDVSSILYSNGEVQAIEHKAQPAQQPQQNYGGYGYGYGYGNNYGGFAGANGPMQRVGNDVFMVEGRTLQGRELLFFLQKTCPQAYNFRKSWQACENAGWSLLATGPVVCLVMGLTMWACCKTNDGVLTGFSFVVIGGAMTLTSIPLVACGNVYKKRVDEVFNTYCGRPQAFQPELKLTSGANGLGLAIAF